MFVFDFVLLKQGPVLDLTPIVSEDNMSGSESGLSSTGRVWSSSLATWYVRFWYVFTMKLLTCLILMDELCTLLLHRL